MLCPLVIDNLARNYLWIFFLFICLYIRLLSCENHVCQGLDTLTPTLVVGDSLKMVSHVLVLFSVLSTVPLGCDCSRSCTAVGTLCLAAQGASKFLHFHEHTI